MFICLFSYIGLTLYLYELWNTSCRWYICIYLYLHTHITYTYMCVFIPDVYNILIILLNIWFVSYTYRYIDWYILFSSYIFRCIVWNLGLACSQHEICREDIWGRWSGVCFPLRWAQFPDIIKNDRPPKNKKLVTNQQSRIFKNSNNRPKRPQKEMTHLPTHGFS